MWDEYRATLLENPDAIELPMDQITGGNTIVAEKSGKTLGFAEALPRSDGNAELDGLFVEPEAWRMGVGRRLIDGAKSLASSYRAGVMYVIANPRAKDFYTACSFVLISETPTRFGPGLVMRKDVSVAE